jgi:ubiquinone/menaquinone biosynthesis C-methylase UbiE
MRFAVLLLLALTAGLLWWRGTGRRRPLPCPSWLAWILDNAFADRLIGTQTTLDRIYLRPGQRVLEIGPGPGRLLIPAAQRVLPGGEVVGLDIQAGMIERLKANATKAGVPNLTTVVGDATQPHFPPEHFDVIYLCTVLGEIPDQEAALRECYCALKPGGVLSITEIFPDPHYQSRDKVQRLAEAVGFRQRELHGHRLFFTANFVRVEKE